MSVSQSANCEIPVITDDSGVGTGSGPDHIHEYWGYLFEFSKNCMS